MATPFEDLPIKDFLKKLEKLGDYTISAQADGLDFYFGFDDEGSFYTSPYSPNRRTKFCYKLSDYPLKVENNQYRSAHQALSSITSKIQEFIKPGEAVQAQLTATAVTQFESAGNSILIIRGVLGESARPKHAAITKLVEKLTAKIQAKVKIQSTADGEELEVKDELLFWKVTDTKHGSGSILTSNKLHSILQKLKTFLAEPNQKANANGIDMSNFEVAAAELNKTPMQYRDVLRGEREKINNKILSKYKLPIKSELITKLEAEFSTQAALLHKGSSDDIWLASDDFKAAARFDTIAKREISGYQRTTDKSASLEDRGGFYGVSQQRIAELLGIPELARYQSAKKIFKSLRGQTPKETASSFAEQLNQLNLNGVKVKIVAILKYTKEEVQRKLNDFKQNATDFTMVTGGGETVTYSPAEIKQNLLQFAETIEHFDVLITGIKKSKSFTDIVLVLYEPIIYSLHGKQLQEELITESIGNPALNTLVKLDATDICHAYTATLLASQLLLRTKDKQTSTYLKDSAHQSLNKYSTSMSTFNFWGHVLFSSYMADMKGHINANTAKDLKKLTGRLTLPRIKKIHQTISSSSNLIQDWDFQEETAKLFAMRLETRGQAINMVIVGIRHWDDISLSDKNTIIAKTFYYLQQHVPTSPLLSRIRLLANTTLMVAAKEDNTTKQTVSDMKENLMLSLSDLAEAEMGSTTMNNAISNTGTSVFADFGTQLDPGNAGATQVQKNKSIKQTQAPQQQLKFMNGKPIIRKKRDFVKNKKFQRHPEPEKIVKEDDGGGTTSGDVGGAVEPNLAGKISSSAIASYPQRLFDPKKKKKRMLKRVIPGYDFSKSIKEANIEFIKGLMETLYTITLDWTDEDYSGDPATDEGFKFLEDKYIINASIIEEKNTDGWPVVKLTGYRSKLVSFLMNEYGASQDFISSNIKPVFGE